MGAFSEEFFPQKKIPKFFAGLRSSNFLSIPLDGSEDRYGTKK